MRFFSRAPKPSAQPLKHFTLTEPGNGHANEDVIAVVSRGTMSECLVCVLADGQGGQAGGYAAARRAVDETLAVSALKSDKALLKPFTWAEIGEKTDKAVATDAAAGMTTYIGLIVHPNMVAGAACGDSLAVLVFGDRIIWLSDNQPKHPAIGSGSARPMPFSARLARDWKLLVVSDGIWKYAGLDFIESQCRSLSGTDVISSLLSEARNEGGGILLDDASAILIEP